MKVGKPIKDMTPEEYNEYLDRKMGRRVEDEKDLEEYREAVRKIEAILEKRREWVELYEKAVKLDKQVEAILKKHITWLGKEREIQTEVMKLRREGVPVPEIADKLGIPQIKVVKIIKLLG